MSRLLFAVVLLALNTPASAYVSSAGDEYDLTCNADGYSLRSKDPISRVVQRGGSARTIAERETLSLGRSCDAHLKAYGKGEWCWANGGFVATFGDEKVGFPRQELSCLVPMDYESNCRC
ncbi:hypothetical protein E3C22_19670 [Jiella endophytica]|uniref:Uncharacterized protein n=1 Tax=Jiella endophytica TaxID=2558362 RepID=A0A4Y8RF84_9HYPH|nr:hypothetical protein [Jiella endophytica]TFF19883.1 hypothetical protein E3C22_19670 [Jiella endophytica]